MDGSQKNLDAPKARKGYGNLNALKARKGYFYLARPKCESTTLTSMIVPVLRARYKEQNRR